MALGCTAASAPPAPLRRRMCPFGEWGLGGMAVDARWDPRM